jgi:hypothetical protein
MEFMHQGLIAEKPSAQQLNQGVVTFFFKVDCSNTSRPAKVTAAGHIGFTSSCVRRPP